MYGNFVHTTNDASHYTKPPSCNRLEVGHDDKLDQENGLVETIPGIRNSLQERLHKMRTITRWFPIDFAHNSTFWRLNLVIGTRYAFRAAYVTSTSFVCRYYHWFFVSVSANSGGLRNESAQWGSEWRPMSRWSGDFLKAEAFLILYVVIIIELCMRKAFKCTWSRGVYPLLHNFIVGFVKISRSLGWQMSK